MLVLPKIFSCLSKTFIILFCCTLFNSTLRQTSPMLFFFVAKLVTRIISLHQQQHLLAFLSNPHLLLSQPYLSHRLLLPEVCTLDTEDLNCSSTRNFFRVRLGKSRRPGVKIIPTLALSIHCFNKLM